MKKLCIAVYLRLSSEDEHKIEKNADSNSIKNQRDIIKKFIDKNIEFNDMVIKEFVDDGYSGVNFERPAIKELLQIIKQGEINCILVKDLSRFGRNYIEVGDFIDKLQPYYGGRLIAVNDKFDTQELKDNVPGIYIAFKLISNAFYSKELSDKARCARQQQIKKGKSIMARPPYGYWKSADKKGTLIIDEQSASIVKLIFQMFLDGESAYKIAKILNSDQIPSPNKRLVLNNMLHFNKDFEDKLYWSSGAVIDILKNQAVIGDMVGNKCAKTKLGARSCKILDKEQWVIVKHTHEPIINSSMFYEVQNIFEERSNLINIRKKREYRSYLFKGKLYCSKCNRVLTKSSEFDKNIRYICRNCLRVRDTATKIDSISLANGFLEALSLREKLLGEKLNILEVFTTDEVVPLENYEKQLKLEESKLPMLYEQYVDGFLSRDLFSTERKTILYTIEELNKKLLEGKDDESYRLSEKSECQNLKKELNMNADMFSLSNELIDKYVDKIIIFEANEFEIIWYGEDYYKQYIKID